MNPVQLAVGGWIASAVGAAATLRIADELSAKPLSIEELAKRTDTNAYALTRMMATLAAVGVFARTTDGHYENTADSELLRSDHPESVRGMCMLFAGDYQRAFQEVLHTLRTGEPASRKVVGGTLYAFLDRNPESGDIYDRAMGEIARSTAVDLAKSYDFSKVDRVVDIGGGRGALLRVLLSAHPHLRGISFDRSDVCTRARAALASEAPELADRLDFQAGSFLEVIPAGAPLYVMKNILHNWNDESCLKILRCARTAVAGGAGARLLVLEPVIESPKPPMYKVLDDFMQVTICEPGVTARSEADFVRLIEGAGLVVAKTSFLATGHCLFEATAPNAESAR